MIGATGEASGTLLRGAAGCNGAARTGGVGGTNGTGGLEGMATLRGGGDGTAIMVLRTVRSSVKCQRTVTLLSVVGARAEPGDGQECVMNVAEASENHFCGGRNRHAHFGREPGEGVGHLFGACVPQPLGVTLIGFQGRADVPAIKGMR